MRVRIDALFVRFHAFFFLNVIAVAIIDHFFWKITAYTSHGVVMMLCENCKDILIIADFIKDFMGKLFSGHPVYWGFRACRQLRSFCAHQLPHKQRNVPFHISRVRIRKHPEGVLDGCSSA